MVQFGCGMYIQVKTTPFSRGIRMKSIPLRFPQMVVYSPVAVEREQFFCGRFCLKVPVPQIPEDVNGDGSVNIDDLRFVADRLHQVGEKNAADVNGDGVVNVLDLVAIAKAMERNPSP